MCRVKFQHPNFPIDTHLVSWLLHIICLCFALSPSVLQWWFIKVLNVIVHHAAELRRTHPLRPPPEPDSHTSRVTLLLVVTCFCAQLVDSSSYHITSHNYTHHVVPSYIIMSKMSNLRDPPQAPLRGGNDEETIWSAPAHDHFEGLEGLTVGGNGGGDLTGLGGLSLGDEFDGEGGFTDDQATKRTVKKGNGNRRVSVDPDGSDASSVQLPSFSRTNSPRAKKTGTSRFSNARVPPTAPSDVDTTGPVPEDAAMRDGLKDLLVEGLLDALGVDPSAMKKKAGDGSDGDKEEKKKSYLPSGVQLRDTARAVDSIGDSKVQITRHDRKNDGSSTQAKLRQRWCTSLKSEFSSPDFSKIFSSDSTEDVASLAIGIQDSLKEFSKWAVATDTYDIFKVPVGVSDYSDLRYVSTATTKSLLTSHNEISLLEAKSFQAFINLNCDDCEGLSSEWCLDKLVNSTEPTLRRRILQTHDALPAAQQGGIVYFKILADECHKDTYQAQKSLKSWIEGFDLRSFNGEDVRAATTKFKAVIDLLGSAAPDKYLKCFLRGMANASCEEFKQTAKTQLGFYGTTPYEMWRQSFGCNERAELDSFGSTFITDYNDHCQANNWSGHGHIASSFKASVQPSSVNAAQIGGKGQAERCTIPGCGGNHATNMHYKLERPRNRRFNNRERNRQNSSDRDVKSGNRDGNRDGRRQVRFKQGSNKKRFEKGMYNVAVECVHEDDLEMFAHLAHGDSDSDQDSQASASGDDASVGQEHANAAAISLDMLLN